jgi:Flp pilus assembly protein TadG
MRVAHRTCRHAVAARSSLRGRARIGPRARCGAQGGQIMVEFALVFPLFIFTLFAFIESGFLYNSVLAMNYATRNAALIAAEAGNTEGADCVVLAQVESDTTVPNDKERIRQVRIFRADRLGNQVASQVYDRTGSVACTLPDGRNVSVPYSLTAGGYPEIARCNQVGGCPALGRSELDTIGVAVDYVYTPKIPMSFTWLGVLLKMDGADFVVTKSNVMRMEPVL